MAPGRPRFDDEGCGPRAGGTHAFSLRFTALRRAWLRVSVESPVGGGVTDRLVVARGCGAASTRIACAGAIEAPRVRVFESNVVTVRTREPVEAGETVTLSVGAAPSDVVVRVVSVVVERAIGVACDPDEGRDVCSQHGRCVRGACLPEGVLESTCRDGASPCDAGLSCVGATAAGPRGVCMRRVAAGAPCVIGDACEGGLCEAAAGASVCRPLGAYLNLCRATEPRCDAPLGCVRAAGEIVERCHRVLASGAACTDDTGRAGVCPSGESCRVSADGRRCARHGAEGGACRSALPVCDAGLACGFSGGEILCLRDASIGTRGGRCGSSPLARCAQGLACDLTTSRCVDALPAAAACSLESQTCAAGLTCGLLAGRPRGEARCVAPGGEGGACRSLAPSCDAGLVCARPPMSRCVRPLPFDALCDSFDTTRACDGECVGGRCRPFGTRGGPCRDVGDACGEGLACVTTSDGARCAEPLPAGARCTLQSVERACAAGTACRLPLRAGEAVCQDDGTIAPPCEPGGVCAAGRRCVSGLCRPVAADGELCFDAVACMEGSTCIYPVGTVFTGQCVRDGSLGAACRISAPECDAGSVCRPVAVSPSRAGRCVAR